jgi:hypothetical protein
MSCMKVVFDCMVDEDVTNENENIEGCQLMFKRIKLSEVRRSTWLQ